MADKKLNCWEFKVCGREPGGARAKELGVCPAATETKLKGVHGGKNSGRACWVVAGTFCEGKVSGTFAVKYQTCKECEFYKRVLEEDYQRFELSMNLLKKLAEE